MIKDNIKRARLLKGLTQGELAEKIGLKSPSAVSNYEKGKSKPTGEILQSMADILEIPVDILMLMETPTGEIDAKRTEEKERDSALVIISKQQDIIGSQQETIAKLVDLVGRAK